MSRLLALSASAAFLFAACSGGGATSAPTGATPTGGTTTPAPSASQAEAMSTVACVAFDTGGLGDKGFNDLAKKGLDDATAAGFTTHFSEAKGATDYANNIQTLIDQGCTALVTVGFLQSQATADAAAANPTIAFAQVDTAWNKCGPDYTCGNADDTPQPANFTGLDYQVDQAAMLAGYLAAGWTKSGKIGTFGGLAFAGVTRFMDGLYAGIQYYNQGMNKSVQLLGWDGSLKDPTTTGAFVGGSGGNDTWLNPAKGEQLAKTLLDQGVDIVHPVAGGTGNGAIKAMQEAGKWAIAVDTDQYISIGPPTNAAILTSAQKAIDVSTLDFFKQVEGGYLGGTDYSGTLANAGVLLAPFHDYESQIPADLKAGIMDLQSKIVDGSVKVCTFLGRGC
ncbi:MAG: BMP family ABC transporter substrate-binding protein [Chloroflexota bacterium]